jgi:broad specificity phosphatase PhoE
MTVDTKGLDVLWGAKQIGRYIGKSDRATVHLLEKGRLPARKVGKAWTSTKKELEAIFTSTRDNDP